MINILELRQQVVDHYRSYVDSFLDVDDPRLRDFAAEVLHKDELWPDPLLECNPGFKKGDTVENLIKAGTLHPDMASIFTRFHLHFHQQEAIALGTKKKGFIVTSGTGSGKSLTYLGSIFNGILELPEAQQMGCKAIIVYPMNALINSQELEIKKYKRNFLQRHLEPGTKWEPGKKSVDEQIEELSKLSTRAFPITFGKYTGQESEEEKQDIINRPRHILLTNYMMLELLLTRSKEQDLRKAIFSDLEYLVFDELHTYRGRQGADVAMLIRRIKAHAQHSLVCIGTSATLSSGKAEDRKRDVAMLGKQLFDHDFEPDQIIGETLENRIKRSLPGSVELAGSLHEPLSAKAGFADLEKHPLACWMERKVALKDEAGKWVRGTPQTVKEIAEKLAEQTGLPLEQCRQRIDEFLQWLQRVNLDEGREFLPFRIHQFIRQTGAMRVTLESPEKREITLSQEPEVYRNAQRMPLFTVAFNRQSGVPYLLVQKQGQRLISWNGRLDEDDSDTESGDRGYLLLDREGEEPLWDDSRAAELLPDSWLEERKSGWQIKKKRAAHLPKAIYFDVEGNWGFEPSPNSLKGWFMLAPLHLDPLSGIIYNSQTRDFNKLAQLGDAGRSISTTILSYTALQQLEEQGASERIRKVLSFTDNRQDAALQTGHFNDFMQQAFLRSAIYHALLTRQQEEDEEPLDQSNIALKVMEAMHLDQEDYAKTPGLKSRVIKENERAFKDWLLYQVFYDLRRGWRHRLPNLEQCALLEVRYKALEEECAQSENWSSSSLLSQFGADQRYAFLVQLLNYFRSSFALQHNRLERGALEEATNRMRERLQSTWLFQEEEELREPYWMRVASLQSKTVYTQSIGSSSSWGMYMKFMAKQHGIELKGRDAVEQEIIQTLDALVELGYLQRNTTLTKIALYRLRVDTLQWVPGDGDTLVLDEVRNRTAKERQASPNPYFQQLYRQPPDRLKSMIAKEHTGQIDAEERQEIEARFRAAQICALFCSPTMELGIDIDELCVVHMRNVPPNPANYAQRSGRAGRKGQGALILTFCSEHSAHDQHFFKERREMVSGNVTPQKLDLCNSELLRSHIHAAYLAQCNLGELSHSLADVLDIEQEGLPLMPGIRKRLQLSEAVIVELVEYFRKLLYGLEPELSKKEWYTDSWVEATLRNTPEAFDRACDRWRQLYDEAFQSREVADARMKLPHLAKSNKEWREAHHEFQRDQRKLDLLKNKGGFRDFSEFYPYRYLASEGFLPGYDFTRLPIRVFLDGGKSGGTYVHRPRLMALSEFGPENTIYQNGTKWKIRQMLLPPSRDGAPLEQASIDTHSGFFTLGEDARKDIHAFSGVSTDDKNRFESLANLMSLQDMSARPHQKISCQEDDRNQKGYAIDTYFSFHGDLKRTRKLHLIHTGDALLNLHYLPAAQLVRLNKKWKKSQQEGFLIQLQNGIWKGEKQFEEASEEEQEQIKRVFLHTGVTADCLYIEPLRNLRLDKNGVTTLMFALKTAIERQFQAEPQELACTLMGNADRPEASPNILFYEAAEGSLGILSQLVEHPEAFRSVVEHAHALCAFDEYPELPASYNDLLSYYNQRYHKQIDRFEIKDTLELMQQADYKLSSSSGFASYDSHFEVLMRALPESAETERAFLESLCREKRRLPDKAAYRPEGCKQCFAFFYLPATGIDMGANGSHTEQGEKKTGRGLQDPERLGIRVITHDHGAEMSAFIQAHHNLFTLQQS